jgi:tetratricopeptide (TPR) repeat protein
MKNIVFPNKPLSVLYFAFFLANCFFAEPVHAQAGSERYSTFYNEGIKQIEQKKYQEARILFNKAIALKSDFGEAIFARGTCSLMLKEWDLACIDFENSAKLNWKPSFEYLEKYCGKDSYGRKINKSKN